MQGFKKFLLRGNAVDLAVAIVIGAAFVTVVQSFVKGFVTPLIGAFGGLPDFSALSFTVNNSKFLVGEFINALVSFAIVAAVVYFLVVLPINSLIERSSREPPADPTTRKCPECLSEIPIAASRCKFCTALVTVSP